jgi:hypothetical protein
LDAWFEERRQILEETKFLKLYATFHLHPEAPVSSDGFACGRNFFYRPSAPIQMTFEESEEKAQILEEAAKLKMYASFHLHPETPVVTTDPTACARNFFMRPSAPDQETVEEAEERENIIADAKALKMYATFHLHPELPVKTTDPTAFGRNFFSRPSAPEQDTFEEAEERMRVLEEAALLKQYATFHLHPELPVKTTDPTAFGRNFFSRPSAPEQDTFEEAEERMRVLEEAALLKQYATFHLHPELPVKTTDPTAFGRNYFSRPSAVEQEFMEDLSQPNPGVLEDIMVVSAASQEQEIHDEPCDDVSSSFLSHSERLIALDAANAPHMTDDQPLGDLSSSYFSHSYNEENYDGYDNHFDLDEDISPEQLRASLSKVIVGNHNFDTHETFKSTKDEDDEGNLSRSPSSIMLFGYDGGNQAF